MANKAIHQFDLNLNGDEDVNLVDDHQPKQRRTQHQIQVLEAVFKDDSNPDYRQRRALGLELGLEQQQVKNWFQNKRIQLKTRHAHQESTELRAENERLKSENTIHMEHLKNVACAGCGGPVVEQMSSTQIQLFAENVRLRAEIDRLSAIAAQYLGKPVTDANNVPRSTTP